MSYGDDLKFYLRVARRRLPLFLIPLVLVGAIGTGIVMYLPAIYSSHAKILVESQQIPEAFVKSTVTALATERIQVIQQRVTSRENLLRIADKFSLFANRKGLSRTDVEELMRDRIGFQILDLGPATRRPRASDGLTVAFSIGFDYERPDVAAKVANELVTLVLNEDIQNRTGRATETTSFLTRETERVSSELQAIDTTIADFKLKNSETLPEKLTFNMSLLEKQQRIVTEADNNIRGAEETRQLLEFEANVRKAQALSGAAPGTQGAQTPEQQLEALKAEYAQRTALYSENHPEMRAMRKLITARQLAVDQAKTTAAQTPAAKPNDPGLSIESRLIAQKLETIDNRIKAFQKQKTEALATIENLQSVVIRTPQVGAELAALERKREALQKSNDDMLNKLSQARLGERMEENQKAERFEVIEAPVVPQEPSRPKRVPLMFLVAGASLGIGGLAAFGAEFLDSTVKRSTDLTGKMNQRLLVVIPYIITRSEVKGRGFKVVLIAIAILLAAILGLVAIHFLYSPLDILTFRIMAKLNSLFN